MVSAGKHARLGALAIALAIGSGLPVSAVAAAAPGDPVSGDSGSASASDPAGRGSPSPGRGQSRSSTRPDQRADRRKTTPQAQAPRPAATQVPRQTATVAPGTAPDDRVESPTVTVPLAAPATVAPTAALPVTRQTAAVAAQPIALPRTARISPRPAAPASVAVAVAAPAPAGTVSTLFGSAPTGTVDSPLSWAVLAASSRALGRPRTLPAATVLTGQTPTAAATSARGSIFGWFGALFFNQTPGIRATLGDQTDNGVIGGVLQTADPDSAPLTFAVSTAPAHGTVALGNDGTFTYTADPSVGPTGTTDLFRITVSDAGTGFHLHGPGSLINLFTFGLIGDAGHTATTTVNVTVAPFTDPPIGGGLSTFCGCTLMPADSVFHADVSTLPVLAKSGTWTALISGNLSAAWGGEPWMNTTAGMPVNTAGADLPTETVVFNRGLVTSGPTIDDRPYAIPDRPLVEGMPNVPAWDRHLLVFREGDCVSQELYNVANGVELPASNPGDALANAIYAGQYGSTWLAEAGVQFDMNSAQYPAIGEANASQLPFMPLILRPDDLTRGSIDHMLGIVVAKDRGTGYAWPARSGDGTGTNPDGVPMGTVFRLRGDFDVSGYDAATQVVLRALKEHGAVVYDSWGAGQDGARLMAMSNGWTGTGYLTAQRELSTIGFSAFEAVDVLTLAVDPSTGWKISV